MNKQDFINNFAFELEKMSELVKNKNSDYAKGWAFSNFELVEQLGITSLEKGIFIRMLDKISRINTLLDKKESIATESIVDSLIDLSCYGVILSIYIKNKKGE